MANGKTVGAEMSYVKGYNDPMADNRVESYYYKVNGEAKATTQTGYDPYKRVNSKYHYIGGRYFSKDITFEKTRPKTVVDKTNSTTIGNTSYTYDAMGRIASVTADGKLTSYQYDAYGQLVRENNQALDKTIIYAYNGIGNLASINEYDFTLSTTPSSTPTTKTFTYDGTVPDKLTQVDTKAIAYNAIGCPTSYNGKSFTWSKGKLASVSSGAFPIANTYTYTYDGYGRRVQKAQSNLILAGSMPSQTTTTTGYYYDNSGRLIREHIVNSYSVGTILTTEKIYLYDESGVIGMVYTPSGTVSSTYYFQRNLQGDVIGIYDVNGNAIAKYAYDAYGNCTILSTTNSTIANANPFRYRGYYLDSETGWYYLNARYYSPEWRRFISPDDTAYLDPETPNGLNLYCYCNNDPINFVDPSGHSAFLIAMSILAVAGLITTGIGLATDNNLVTAIGLTAVAVPALISGGFAIWGTAGALSTGIGATTMVAGGFTGVFAGAEYQEALTGQNFILNTGISESLYNSLMLTTAGIATLGTISSSLTYSFNMKRIIEFGKIKGSDYPGIKFIQTNKGRELYRSLEFHYGHMHKGHSLHWQLNKWSPSGSVLKGGTAWWTIWFKRIP